MPLSASDFALARAPSNVLESLQFIALQHERARRARIEDEDRFQKSQLRSAQARLFEPTTQQQVQPMQAAPQSTQQPGAPGSGSEWGMGPPIGSTFPTSDLLDRQRNSPAQLLLEVGNSALAPSPAATPSPTSRPDRLALNPEAFREYAALDPEGALTLQTKLSSLSEADRKQAAAAGEAIGLAAATLQDLPPHQWQEEMGRMVPQLRARGVPDEMIRDFDFTPQGLNRARIFGRTLVQADRQDNWEDEFEARQSDRSADNARADRNTASMIERRNRPPVSRAPTPRAPTAATVTGRVMEKVARGEQLTAGEREIFDRSKPAPRGAGRPTSAPKKGGGVSSGYAVDAKGNAITWDGKAWVPAK